MKLNVGQKKTTKPKLFLWLVKSAQALISSSALAHKRGNTCTSPQGASPSNLMLIPLPSGAARSECKHRAQDSSPVTQTVPQAQHNLADRTAAIALLQHIPVACDANAKHWGRISKNVGVHTVLICTDLRSHTPLAHHLNNRISGK